MLVSFETFLFVVVFKRCLNQATLVFQPSMKNISLGDTSEHTEMKLYKLQQLGGSKYTCKTTTKETQRHKINYGFKDAEI